MTITDRTRKMLWGNAANRCAICRQKLSKDSTNKDNEAIIGEECHVVAHEINGPRGNAPLPLDQRDEYQNLILLCRNHHKEIDDQPNTFTVELLKEIKSNHEAWVQTTLESSGRANKVPLVFFLFRIDTGKHLCDTIMGCHAYHFDNDALETEEEADAVGDFMQEAQDYGDIWGDIGVKDKVKAQFTMDEYIRGLRDLGFVIYATSRRERFTTEAIQGFMDFEVAYMLVKQSSNALVKRKDSEILMFRLSGRGEARVCCPDV